MPCEEAVVSTAVPCATLVAFLPFLAALADDTSQVAAFAMLHDNVNLGGCLVDDAIVVAHDEWVPQLAQDVDLLTTTCQCHTS